MIRLALLIAVGLMTMGCSTSRRVVVQNGYPGIQPPPGFEARPAVGPSPTATPTPAPGSLHYVPDAGPGSISPPAPTAP